MPFTLTFDANQEASARKYYARVKPATPVTPNDSPVIVSDACPQVLPPMCTNGKLVTTYGTDRCRTPQFKCEPLADPLAWCRSSFDVNKCSSWWTSHGCVVNMNSNGTGSISCPR